VKKHFTVCVDSVGLSLLNIITRSINGRRKVHISAAEGVIQLSELPVNVLQQTHYSSSVHLAFLVQSALCAPSCPASSNTMQSETADVASCAATRRTGRNIRVVFDSGTFAPLCENMTSSTKPEVHNVLHCRQRIDRATATANR